MYSSYSLLTNTSTNSQDYPIEHLQIMSLDCYPFGKQRVIELDEQPIAIDVAYDDDLLISVVNQCQSIVVYDLSSSSSSDDSKIVAKFSLGHNIVIDQVIYCRTGDYLACVGYKDELVSVYNVFDWRLTDQEPNVQELNLNTTDERNLDDEDSDAKRNKLNSIDCCQKTGNLAVSLKDEVLIYRFVASSPQQASVKTSPVGNLVQPPSEDDDTLQGSNFNSIWSDIESNAMDATAKLYVNSGAREYFEHVISIKLAIHASKVCLLENYLAITAMDHVQVLKLELLTLQIQSEGLDLAAEPQPQAFGSGGVINHRADNCDSSSANSVLSNGYNVCQSETASETTSATTTCSMISESNSTATNFSSINSNTNINNNNGDISGNKSHQLNNSELSIITMNQHGHADIELEMNGNSNKSSDDCITWNLNTKKLVKLPTLMHNTSTNLSSYHICHPLELLGPASESIACRVGASIYSQDFCQNQLEAVVMICKQIDFEKDPIKSTCLDAIYLSSYEDQRRLSAKGTNSSTANSDLQTDLINGTDQVVNPSDTTAILKSPNYQLLASVTCFISTLTSCYVYSLHGKKVSRTQTISYPDLCLDLRPDLLNIYLLTPIGLQICSTGICDSIFRYDWSSSSDLNLSFIATTNRARILTSSNYAILVDSSASGGCQVEYLEKPNLSLLYDRVVHTIDRCNSISIRSNLLTYLHAMAQLSISSSITGNSGKILNYSDSQSDDSIDMKITDEYGQITETDSILRTVTVMLCKQLLQKKQTNVITNGRIDKAIKHLLDISFCDLIELMQRHPQLSKGANGSPVLEQVAEDNQSFENSGEEGTSTRGVDKWTRRSRGSRRRSTNLSCMVTMDDDDKPLDTDYELIKIYLKHAKFSQSLVNYLVSHLADEKSIKTMIGLMFDHNPRLLIKCAQRFPVGVDCNNSNGNSSCNKQQQRSSLLLQNGSSLDRRASLCLMLLVNKLEQLVEYDSTGINRATVLFTLAILYNHLDEREKCFAALGQIKPLNHLAITMCSNYEISHSIANVVRDHYPDVYNLFLAQLTKRDKLAALRFNVVQHQLYQQQQQQQQIP